MPVRAESAARVAAATSVRECMVSASRSAQSGGFKGRKREDVLERRIWRITIQSKNNLQIFEIQHNMALTHH